MKVNIFSQYTLHKQHFWSDYSILYIMDTTDTPGEFGHVILSSLM